jgi:hypothetical protein
VQGPPSAPLVAATTLLEGTTTFRTTVSTFDAAGEAATFTLGGADAGSFALSGATTAAGGTTSATLSYTGTAMFNGITQPSYALTLVATNTSGLASAPSHLTLHVPHLPPPAPSLSSTSLPEGTTASVTLSAS